MLTFPKIQWVSSPNFSSRGGQRVRLVVVHDCEGSYAGSVAWFSLHESRVSAHLVLREDGGEATQMVRWTDKAWHACDFNSISDGIEAAGYSARGLGDAEWRTLAALTAWRLRANNIPCQEATLVNGWTGFTEHLKLGAAGGGHHDITANPEVWADFVRLVGEAYNSPTLLAPILPVPFRPSGSDRRDAEDHKNPEPASVRWDLTTTPGLQRALNALPLMARKLVVDGDYGEATTRTVAAFQKWSRLPETGAMDDRTRQALMTALG